MNNHNLVIRKLRREARAFTQDYVDIGKRLVAEHPNSPDTIAAVARENAMNFKVAAACVHAANALEALQSPETNNAD